eukprot:tig00000881_g5223.t1
MALRVARETGMFVNPPSVNDDLHCPICFCIFVGPMRVSCHGGHTFCKACHDKLFQNGVVAVCPTCRQEINKDASEENKQVEAELRQRLTFCPYKDNGCVWEGPLWKRERHSRRCEQAKHACVKNPPQRESFLVMLSNYLERKEDTGEERATIDFIIKAGAEYDKKWKLRIHPNGTNDGNDEDLKEYLGIFLQRADGAPFKTDFTITLLNKNTDKNISWDAEMDTSKSEHGDTCFMTLVTVANPAAGFLQGGALLFHVEIGPKGPDTADLLGCAQKRLELKQSVQKRLEALHTAREGRDSFVVVVPDYLELKEATGDARGFSSFKPESNDQWILKIFSNGQNGLSRSKEHLAVYLQRADGASFKTDFTITLLNEDPSKNVLADFRMTESEVSRGRGRTRFETLARVADPAAGFLADGALVFVVEIGPKGPDTADLLGCAQKRLELKQSVQKRLEALHTAREGRESFVVVVPDYLELKEATGDARGFSSFKPESNDQWNLKLFPNGENDDRDGASKEHLAVYLQRADGASFKTDFTIKLLNEDPTKTVALDFKMDNTEIRYGRSSFETLACVADPAAGFLADGALVFVVEIGPKGPDTADLLGCTQKRLELKQSVQKRLEALHTAREGRESFVVVVPDYLELKEATGDARGFSSFKPESNDQWNFKLFPNGENDDRDGASKEHLAVYLQRADGASFKTDFTIKLLNEDPTKTVAVDFKMDNTEIRYGRSSFETLACVADPAAGFLADGALVFVVEIGPKGPDTADLLGCAQKRLESEQLVRKTLEALHTGHQGRESFIVVVPDYLELKEATGEGRRYASFEPEGNDQWKLEIAPNGENDDGGSKEHLAVYLQRADGAPFKTDFCVKLLNEDPRKSVPASFKMFESKVNFGRTRFETLARVADPAAGFLRHGALLFFVVIGSKGPSVAELRKRAEHTERVLTKVRKEAAAVHHEKSTLLADAAAKRAELEEEIARLERASKAARRELEAERQAREAALRDLAELKRKLHSKGALGEASPGKENKRPRL